MIANTFTLAQGELRRVQGHVGDFTLYYWKYILASTLSGAVLWGPLKNSFICGFFTVRELRELTRLQQKTEKTN